MLKTAASARLYTIRTKSCLVIKDGSTGQSRYLPKACPAGLSEIGVDQSCLLQKIQYMVPYISGSRCQRH